MRMRGVDRRRRRQRPPAVSRRRSSLLTRSGGAFLVGLIVLALAGWVLGYGELVVLALVGLILLVLAGLVPRLATPVTVERRVARRLVERGHDVHVHLTVRSERRQPPLRLLDRLDDRDVLVDVPALGVGEQASLTYRLATGRRGLHQVGPLVEERSDPLGLASRTVSHHLVEQVWVHPVLHRLTASTPRPGRSLGRRDVHGVAQDPNEDFRGLREYVAGDDPRRIHWPSTARTGELVVREQAEARRQTRLVVLETHVDAASASEFEEAVEIAASLAMHGIEERVVLTARTRCHDAPGLMRPVVQREQVLELFTVVRRTSAADTLPLRTVFAHAGDIERVYFVTGPHSPAVAELSARPRLRHHLTIVRVSNQATPPQRMGGRVVDVRSASEFALRWSGR